MLNDILHTEYSYPFDTERELRLPNDLNISDFDNKRQYRMAVSYYKYGPAKKNYGEGRVDAILTADDVLWTFEKDHNLEHLIDAVNYLMLRWMYPFPNETFTATGKDGKIIKTKTNVNHLTSANEHIALFKQDKNLEHLIHAANHLTLRYFYPLDGEHYRETGDDEAVKTVGTPINME